MLLCMYSVTPFSKGKRQWQCIFTTWLSILSTIFAIAFSHCSATQETCQILWNVCSQELSTGPCLEPDESSTQLHIVFLQDTFQFYPFTDILVTVILLMLGTVSGCEHAWDQIVLSWWQTFSRWIFKSSGFCSELSGE
jgi:hypothetical protein